MKHTSILTAVALSTTMLIASCKSDSTSSNNNNPSNSTPANTMTATVSGSNMTFIDGYTMQSYKGQAALVVLGIDSVFGRNMTLTLVNVTAPGTYNVGTITPGSLNTYCVVAYTYADATKQPQSYSSPITPGLTSAGTVTVTQFDTVGVKGTFNATVTKLSGSTGPSTETITNGAFNASFVH